jgi:polysaccharide export outer membrane protein
MTTSREARYLSRKFPAHAMRALVVLLTAAMLPPLAFAQFAGPAPTRSDSPNPDNKGLVQRAPTEVATGRAIVLHPGDLISVSVYGVPDYRVKVRIAGNGVVDLPLIGGVPVAGMTVEQAQHEVAQHLIDRQMILDPDVLIQVEDSMVDVITVTGEVFNPRAIPAYAPMSLMDAIGAVGGLKPEASHNITILRKGATEPLLVVLSSNPAQALQQNVPLYPGDRVLVPRVGVVYVVGAVTHAGAYPISPNTPLTAFQAVTLAGGVGFQAARSEARIIRTSGGKRHEIPFNLGKVMKGTAQDPIVQSDDIVYIPTSATKAAIKGGGIGIAVGLLYLLPYFLP